MYNSRMSESSKNYLSCSRMYTVAVDEVDFAERLKPSSVLQYFQDLATEHADIIGIGYETMLKKNLIWVLTNVSVRFHRYPTIGESIKVTTFPRKPAVAYALRDYYITDCNNNVLISGTSKWVTIDVKSRMIRRCNVLFDFADEVYIPNAPFEDGNKTVIFDEDAENALIMTDKVRITDIDRNKHMNNARYGDMMLNAFTMEKLTRERIVGFDINFVSEMKYGDDYGVCLQDFDNCSKLKTVRNGDTVFRAEIRWEKNV